ncbi:hypothetical protein B0H14DRAFT_2590338 [Mycena olivaceomarginata]|nr:hypothetical protein B0H14DRAFT_2590338 [Mycena olivaceomarginata]
MTWSAPPMNKFVFAVLAAEALKPPRFAMGLCRGERDRLRVRCMSTTDRRNQPKRIAFEDQLWHDLLAENWFSTKYDRARKWRKRAEYGTEGLAELPMRTQREKGCNREGDSADVVRSARAAARGGCSAGQASVARGNARGEGGAQCTAHGRGHAAAGTVARWMWDATGVLRRKRRRWFYSARIGEQDWQGEDTAARWTLSGTGVPTGGCGAALLALTTRGGGRADTEMGVQSGLHGTGVAAHGRRVRQRGGREAGRMGRESAVARQIRDGYSDAGAERAQRPPNLRIFSPRRAAFARVPILTPTEADR